MSLKNRLKLKQSREKFKTEKKHGQSRSIGGRGNQRTEYWNAKTRKWQRTKPAPLPRKVEVEKTKPETRQERIKREGLATWRVNSEAQKKLNIDKKKVKAVHRGTKAFKDQKTGLKYLIAFVRDEIVFQNKLTFHIRK